MKLAIFFLSGWISRHNSLFSFYQRMAVIVAAIHGYHERNHIFSPFHRQRREISILHLPSLVAAKKYLSERAYEGFFSRINLTG